MDKDALKNDMEGERFISTNNVQTTLPKLKKDQLVPESNSFKSLIPQIYATYLASAENLFMGMMYTYASVLLPQIQTAESPIQISDKGSLIVSAATVTIAVTQLATGVLADKYGKINLLVWSAIPSIGGWILIGAASDVWMIVIGRFLCGFGAGLSGNPAGVYVTEIARPHIRGALLVSIPLYMSLGITFTYIQGYFLNWRTIALVNCFLIAVSKTFMWFLPESPIWLMSKGRISETTKSLDYYNKYYPCPSLETKTQLRELLLENNDTSKNTMEDLSSFKKPSGYRPLLVLIGLFFFQQFSGIYVVLFLAIQFFQNSGVHINAYLASTLIGLTRLILSFIAIWTMKTFNRRSLMLISVSFMGISIMLSGLFNFWIQQGTITAQWIPLIFLLLFVVFATVGLIPIPWFMSAELFPTNIRGVGQGIATFVGSGLLAFNLYLYQHLEQFLGGAHAVQLLYSAVCIVGVLFVWFFLPETHNKKLIEIERYFEANVYFKRRNDLSK